MDMSDAAAPRPYDRVKRGMDIILSSSGLAVGSIPMIVIAVLVRAKLGSPVLFTQHRPGRGGRSFKLLKFRTMTDERGLDGELLVDKKRMTAFGSFLRKSSLDELPELFNILLGDMSLVGPRPLLHRYTPYFTEEEHQRFSVRPGLTGWAQVNGRNTTSWEKRLALDIWYVRNRSLALDLKILAMTLAKALAGAGVVVDPSSTMQDLDVERMVLEGVGNRSDVG